MKGDFYYEGKHFNFKENIKTITIRRKIYSLEIEGEDKEYTKKNYKKLKELVKLYYLKKGDI